MARAPFLLNESIFTALLPRTTLEARQQLRVPAGTELLQALVLTLELRMPGFLLQGRASEQRPRDEWQRRQADLSVDLHSALSPGLSHGLLQVLLQLKARRVLCGTERGLFPGSRPVIDR